MHLGCTEANRCFLSGTWMNLRIDLLSELSTASRSNVMLHVGHLTEFHKTLYDNTVMQQDPMIVQTTLAPSLNLANVSVAGIYGRC